MTRDIYEVSIELVPNPGAEFPEESEGAFVFCYVPADSLRDSIDLAQEYLEAEDYRIIDVDRVVRVEFDDYEPHDEDHPSLEDLRSALSLDDVVTGPYLCYEADDE
jgi:hypothetical protein